MQMQILYTRVYDKKVSSFDKYVVLYKIKQWA